MIPDTTAPDTAITLGHVIRTRRLELGLTQEELADRVGERLTQSDISRIERGTIALPRRQRLEELAAALGLSLGELLIRSGWMNDGHEGTLSGADEVAMVPGLDGNKVDPILVDNLLEIDARLTTMATEIAETRQALRSVMRALKIAPAGDYRTAAGVIRMWETSTVFRM